VEGTYGYLEESHPGYIFDCPVRNITISSVPKASVKQYYRPRERLKSIFEDGPRDDLESKLVDLVTILSGLSGVGVDGIGVTGSILTGNHSPKFSDMDIAVYGAETSSRLKEVILGMRNEHNLIQPFNAAKKELWSRSRMDRFPLGLGELMEFAERRWNYGIYSDTYFSLHPVRTDGEIREEYGDNTYRQIGSVTGRATVSDSSESIFLPAIYAVDNIKTDGNEDAEITEIVSYEGLFCDMFDEGERVEFSGALERVTGRRNYYRVVVGGAGSQPSYIKRIAP
jgi:predicted nucleotidyltransferase